LGCAVVTRVTVKEKQAMLKMLIAVDGSAHARRAIDTVARLAPMVQGGIRAVLLNVAKPMLYYGDLPPLDYETFERLQRQQQEQVLEAAAAEARAGGLADIAMQSAVGEPATEILRVAQEHAVEQIVMGTHGRGQLGALFLGSVAQRVLQGTTVPVLLVR
jgi:nucleotide-binding universal stress UspA family protein